MYICDRNNHRIQVFDLDLNFIRSISSHGRGRGKFDAPHDVKLDTAGNMYVAEWGNARVQVIDSSGHFIRFFGHEGKGKLNTPSALHILNEYVYVSDWRVHCIVVYDTSGNFVTSFGPKEGWSYCPCCITSCADGFICVCDYGNSKVHVFRIVMLPMKNYFLYIVMCKYYNVITFLPTIFFLYSGPWVYCVLYNIMYDLRLL